MEIELLHIHHGDKKKQIDTREQYGRNEVAALLRNLFQQKCAVFLERNKKTYRVVGYDPIKDELLVETGRGKRKKTAGMKTENAKATCHVAAAAAKVAAVAPVAGG